MKFQTKKIIAVEVLVFLCAMLLSVILFLLVYPYNRYYESKKYHIAEEIHQKYELADSLSLAFNGKDKLHMWFYDLNAKESGEYYSLTPEELWTKLEKILQNDSLEYNYAKVWDKAVVRFLDKVGFHDINSFKVFIEQNSITDTDRENKENAKLIEMEIEPLIWEKVAIDNKIVSNEEQRAFALKSFIFLLIILYPFRLFYFGIAWSIKTLKEKA